MTPNEAYFRASCKVEGVPFSLANRIIDGRYKPYLSALDDAYYDHSGSTIWDAKFEALQAAIKRFGKEGTIAKLKALYRPRG